MLDYNDIEPIFPILGPIDYDIATGFAAWMKGEYLVMTGRNNNYYFICDADCDIEGLNKYMDWYIIGKTDFNDHLCIGYGLTDKNIEVGEAYACENETTLKNWREILRFTFTSDFGKKFYPSSNIFEDFVSIDGADCYYLYDYHPVARNKKLTAEERKISNLVFRFKEGAESHLVAHIFSLAIQPMGFYEQFKNPIFIPIAASTRKRHQIRFAKFLDRLSKLTFIPDGYRAVWIDQDREQMKGTAGQDKLAGLSFNKK